MTKEDALVRLYVAYGGKKEDVDKLDRTADIVNKMAEYVEEHGGGGGGGSITVDDFLSLTSTNPVQNKVMTAAINAKADITEVQTDVNTAVEQAVPTAVNTAVEQAVPTAVNEGINDNTATQTDVDDVIGDLDPLP